MEASQSDPWQNTVGLLRYLKNDYEIAKKQLEIAYQTLSEHERAASQMLLEASLLQNGYRILCLAPVTSGATTNQIGRVVLGTPFQFIRPPQQLKLEVRCFERLEVLSDGRKLEHWQNANARSLFRLFIIKLREPLIKDVIIEYLWPQSNPQTANNNLKVAVYGLRKKLNRFLNQKENLPSIIFNGGTYQINPEIELRTDVEQFEGHWMNGRRFEKEGDTLAAFKEYEMAEALYRGDYLEDEPYDDSTFIRREMLKDTYLIILGKLADYLLDKGDYEGSIIYCQKIIARDNCREDAYRRLMLCYNGMDNRNGALRWYDICCQTVKTELDTTPDHKTVDLYHRLFREERT